MVCFCVCVFWFDRAVVLVAVFLHKSPLPPHRRGFFCSDDSIRLSYQSSTVSSVVLTAVGVGLPVLTVSPAAAQRQELGGLGSAPEEGGGGGSVLLPVVGC